MTWDHVRDLEAQAIEQSATIARQAEEIEALRNLIGDSNYAWIIRPWFEEDDPSESEWSGDWECAQISMQHATAGNKIWSSGPRATKDKAIMAAIARWREARV